MERAAMVWFGMSLLSGCGVGAMDVTPASTGVLTDDDRNTWFRGCRAVVNTPGMGTHPANCALAWIST